MPTLQRAAVVALQVQDAVNLSAVVLEFHEVLRETMWPEARKRGLGMDWINRHAITTLFLDKLCDLNGVVTDSNKLALAYAEVKAIAESKLEAS